MKDTLATALVLSSVLFSIQSMAWTTSQEAGKQLDVELKKATKDFQPQ